MFEVVFFTIIMLIAYHAPCFNHRLTLMTWLVQQILSRCITHLQHISFNVIGHTAHTLRFWMMVQSLPLGLKFNAAQVVMNQPMTQVLIYLHDIDVFTSAE